MRISTAVLGLFLVALVTPRIAQATVIREIQFIADSSGSMFDSTFTKWKTVTDFIDHVITTTHQANENNAYGIINFAGQDPDRVPYEADTQIIIEYSLTDSQALPDLAGFLDGFDESYFLRGHTRMNDALRKATEDLDASNNPNAEKFMFILTDDGSIPASQIPADLQGFVSDVLQQLRDRNVRIFMVAIGFDPAAGGLPEVFETIPDAPGDVLIGSDYATTDFSYLTIPIPEPTTALLQGIALLVLAALGVGRRRVKA